jgi:hypothetical protein
LMAAPGPVNVIGLWGCRSRRGVRYHRYSRDSILDDRLRIGRLAGASAHRILIRRFLQLRLRGGWYHPIAFLTALFISLAAPRHSADHSRPPCATSPLLPIPSAPSSSHRPNTPLLPRWMALWFAVVTLDRLRIRRCSGRHLTQATFQAAAPFGFPYYNCNATAAAGSPCYLGLPTLKQINSTLSEFCFTVTCPGCDEANPCCKQLTANVHKIMWGASRSIFPGLWRRGGSEPEAAGGGGIARLGGKNMGP